ncbi:MAG: mycothiol synthase [Actinomycetota bacterium]|nr:mycothiol synthase [Actinomycetota bacterium]
MPAPIHADLPRPELRGRLAAEEIHAVHNLIEQAAAADGTAPLSEHVLLHLPSGGDAEVRNLLVSEGESLLAYGHLDVTDTVEGSSAELVVTPPARGRGLGKALVEALLSHSPDGRLRLWAHGDLPAARRLAESLGFRRSRVLLQMRRHLSGPQAPDLPDVALPPGVALRTFSVGTDEQAWTRINNRAFADHPDQGGWGVEQVRLREDEQWFDPAGFFLAERDGQLVGFHWTKVHGGHASGEPHDHLHPGTEHPEAEHHDHPPIGEVYIVGVDPSEQGQGLGPALTLAGLHSLQQRGLTEVLLYVDESNAAAVRVYERLGFTRHAVDVMYSRGELSDPGQPKRPVM